MKFLLLALKGCAMGMADVVPGVSGGTIAFVSGIYEELIASIRSVDAAALRLYRKAGFADSGYVDPDAPDCVNLILSLKDI